ncbi:MAG: glycogen-binding domain-containing protein [Gemmatimonadaceae bacterium]
MRSRRAAPIAFAAAALAAPSAAQVSPSVEAGVIGTQYAGGAAVGGAVLAPSVRYQRNFATVDAGGSVASLAQGASSVQWFVGGSAFTPALSIRSARVAGEMAGGADGYSADHFRVGQQLGVARAHIYQEEGGLWLEGGLGHARRDDAAGEIVLGGLGAWRRAGSATITLSMTHTRFELRGGEFPVPRDAFTDVGGALQWSGPRVDVDLAGGARTATTQSALNGWGSLASAWWLAPHAALVGVLARAPEDPTRGLLSGTTISFGVRLGLRAQRRRVLPREHSREQRPFVLGAGDHGDSNFSVDAPRAARVELMGDFTDWKPVPLARADGSHWSLLMPITPGTYHVSIRIDGGKWMAPPGVPAFADGFDGTVGVIVVR